MKRTPDATTFATAAAARRMPFATVALAEPEVADIYQRRLVLVRPDGHVAWRGDEMPSDAAAVIDQVRGATASYSTGSMSAWGQNPKNSG